MILLEFMMCFVFIIFGIRFMGILMIRYFGSDGIRIVYNIILIY